MKALGEIKIGIYNETSKYGLATHMFIIDLERRAMGILYFQGFSYNIGFFLK